MTTTGNRQLLKNTFWSGVELGLYPLLMIAATPLFINRLGAELYGIWMLVNSLVQTLHSLNFGLGDSTIRQVSALRAKEETAFISLAVSRNLALAFLILLLCMLLAWVAGAIPPVFQWLNIEAASSSTVKKIVLLGGVSAGLKFSELVLLGLFKGYERFDIASRLSLLSRCSVVLVNMAIVAGGGTLEMVFTGTVIVNVVNLLIQLVAIRIRLPHIRLAPALPHFAPEGHHFWYWLQSVIALLGFLSDKFLVAHFFDLKTLGYYSLGSLIMIQVHNMMLSFGSFLFPKVSFRLNSNQETAPMFNLAMAGLHTFGWTVLITLLCLGPWAFRLWLGEETFTAASHFINLFLVYGAVILLIIAPYHFLNGTPQVKLNSLFEAVLRTSHVLAMLLGYRLGGSEGLIWGLIIATFINIPFQYTLFFRSQYNRSRIATTLSVLAVPLLFVAFILAPVWAKGIIAGCILLTTWLLYRQPIQYLVKRSLA